MEGGTQQVAARRENIEKHTHTNTLSIQRFIQHIYPFLPLRVLSIKYTLRSHQQLNSNQSTVSFKSASAPFLPPTVKCGHLSYLFRILSSPEQNYVSYLDVDIMWIPLKEQAIVDYNTSCNKTLKVRDFKAPTKNDRILQKRQKDRQVNARREKEVEAEIAQCAYVKITAKTCVSQKASFILKTYWFTRVILFCMLT